MVGFRALSKRENSIRRNVTKYTAIPLDSCSIDTFDSFIRIDRYTYLSKIIKTCAIPVSFVRLFNVADNEYLS